MGTVLPFRPSVIIVGKERYAQRGWRRAFLDFAAYADRPLAEIFDPPVMRIGRLYLDYDTLRHRFFAYGKKPPDPRVDEDRMNIVHARPERAQFIVGMHQFVYAFSRRSLRVDFGAYQVFFLLDHDEVLHIRVKGDLPPERPPRIK